MQKLYPLLFLALPFSITAQVLPDSVRVDWSKAGLEFPVPDFQNIIDVTSFGAIPNDTTDDRPAVLSAIASLNNTAGVIYFPAGNYLIRNTIALPDSTVIRGAGSDSTTLSFNFSHASANSFDIGTYQGNIFHPIVSGYQKDSRKLMVSSANTLFAAGDEIEIREANGTWDIVPASWATYSVGHFARIDSVNTDTLWINEALRINFEPALNPEIRKVTPRKLCGLECFKMVRVDTTSVGINYGSNFVYAKNCWMRGVESEKSICAHVALDGSSHIDISGCFFHDAYLYDGGATRGYGVVVIAHATSNLIEDNIFKHLRHAMITKQGANGNVFGYNYSIEPNRSEPIADYAADMCLHGHYAFSNLYEGNIGQNLQIDIVWGPSGPYNTFFRNKVELYGILMSSGSVQSDKQNFVGNDVSSSQILQGNYILYGTGHVQYGNNIKGTITPSGTSPLNDVSYYLDSVPPFFWNIAQPLPAVGIPNAFAADNNPARVRYVTGGVVTRCAYLPYVDTTIQTSILKNSAQGFAVKNYFINNSEVNITLENSQEEFAQVQIISVSGQMVLHQKIILHEGISTYAAKTANLSAGIYLLQISTVENNWTGKCVVE